jgi:hypothetical protein
MFAPERSSDRDNGLKHPAVAQPRMITRGRCWTRGGVIVP